MNEELHDDWFYTSEGERFGPITLADLRVKVLEGGLNPRLDLVWNQRLTDWTPAGEIDGLFERREPPPLRVEASRGYPKHESVEETMNQIVDWPGARRRSFLIATMIFPWLWNLALAGSAGWLSGQFGDRLMGPLIIGVASLPLVVGIYYSLQRLANLGMSRWWYLAQLVPGLNLWLGYRCVACPAGYAYHKKLDSAGVVLAILYWLVVVGVLVVAVVAAAVVLGMLGSAGLQERLHEAIRVLSEFSTKP